jgi:hypothetical protein
MATHSKTNRAVQRLRRLARRRRVAELKEARRGRSAPSSSGDVPPRRDIG